MIWLTWRQFRTQAWVTATALAALAIALGITGTGLAHLYDTSGIATCHASGSCGRVAASFLQVAHNSQADTVMYNLGIAIVFALPAISGLFWGAPLITREFEAGTFRLAWNQSITRTRWLAVKLGLIGLVSMASAAVVIVMTSWWASPIYRAAGLAEARNGSATIDRFTPLQFGATGIAPVGYAAFAFALGVTAGVLIRRTVPAMAITLATFAAIQVVMPLWIRPHLMAPLSATSALNTAAINGLSFAGPHMTVYPGVNLPDAWVLSIQTTTAAGQLFTGPPPRACERASFQACQAALGRLHLRQVVTYQPASRYWPFQWYETGIFLALALVLAGFCLWWVRRRRVA
jgi:hypothetical protein